MDNLLEELYSRYNQFNGYEDIVKKPYTLIKILREGKIDKNGYKTYKQCKA